MHHSGIEPEAPAHCYNNMASGNLIECEAAQYLPRGRRTGARVKPMMHCYSNSLFKQQDERKPKKQQYL